MDQPSPNYIVSIPLYEDLRSFDGKIYTSYTVKVFNIETGKEWVVSKRYRDFYYLYNCCKEDNISIRDFSFPKKTLNLISSSRLKQSRLKKFESLLTLLFSINPIPKEAIFFISIEINTVRRSISNNPSFLETQEFSSHLNNSAISIKSQNNMSLESASDLNEKMNILKQNITLLEKSNEKLLENSSVIDEQYNKNLSKVIQRIETILSTFSKNKNIKSNHQISKIETIMHNLDELDTLIQPFNQDNSSLINRSNTKGTSTLEINITDIEVNNIVIFFPTPEGEYAAFNIAKPYHFLSEETKEVIKLNNDRLFNSQFVLGKIILKEKIQAETDIAKYDVKAGEFYYLVSLTSVTSLYDQYSYFS